MKLRTFYVKSYRSITEATLDNIQNYGVFVGPNNAGKSNLLRAIYISLSIALEGDFQRARRNRQYSYAYRGENYNWERDIPVNLRENKGASTTFKLTFEFSDEEKADFRQKFNINLTKSLQMKFQLFSNRTEYNIIMPGRAKKPMEEKMQDSSPESPGRTRQTCCSGSHRASPAAGSDHPGSRGPRQSVHPKHR